MDTDARSELLEVPAPQRYGLYIAAVVVALLGLTVADVADRPKKQAGDVDERSAECIVASAVFAGVHPVP